MNTRNRPVVTTLVAGLTLSLFLSLAGCAGSTPAASPSASASASASAAPSTTATSTPAAAVAPFPAETAAAIEKAAADAVSRDGIPGAIVLVQTPAGRYEQTFGVADRTTGTPLDIADHLRVGSITKTMTITVLLQQVDAGTIELDAPASSYLPQLPAAWKDVTVRQLAEMRSGIPTFTGTQAFGEAYAADTSRQFTSDELIGYAEALPVLFAPGTDFNYSNSNTVILGMIIEKVTGESLADELQALYDEAGLTETAYAETAAEFPSPRAQGYTFQTPDGSEADSTDWNTSWAQAAGSAVSTVGDLELWLEELTSGSLLSAESQRERLDLVSIPRNPEGTGYGLGIARTNGWLGHSGDVPGFSSTMYSRDDGSIIIVLTSTDAPVKRSDGTAIAASAGIAEAITAVVLPDAPFVFPTIE